MQLFFLIRERDEDMLFEAVMENKGEIYKNSLLK